MGCPPRPTLGGERILRYTSYTGGEKAKLHPEAADANHTSSRSGKNKKARNEEEPQQTILMLSYT